MDAIVEAWGNLGTNGSDDSDLRADLQAFADSQDGTEAVKNCFHQHYSIRAYQCRKTVGLQAQADLSILVVDLSPVVQYR